MSWIKFECPSTVCQGCLSSDRTLTPLENNLEIFLYLSGKEQDMKYIMLCWECRALLSKIQRFRKRIRNAQFMLQKRLCNLITPVAGLSTLKQVYINDFERVEHQKRKQHQKHQLIETGILKPPHNIEDKKPVNNVTDIISKIQEDNKQEPSNVEYEDGIDANDDFYDPEDPDYESPEIKQEKIHKSKKSYENNENRILKVIKNPNVDETNFNKHYSKVPLSFSEIEELIETDNSKRRWKIKLKCKMESDGKQCSNYYNTLTDLRRHEMLKHIVVNHPGPYKCSECSEEILDASSLFSHWEQHTFLYKCDFCGEKKRAHDNDLKHHVLSHKQQWACTDCNIKFLRIEDFKKHYDDLHKVFVCDHCQWTGTTKKSIQNHIARKHTPPYCSLCDRMFLSHVRYRKHREHCHDARPKPSQPSERDELAYCVECNKQFPSVQKYNTHIATAQIHNPDKLKESVSCLKCKKLFSSKYGMIVHYRHMHEGKTKFFCAQCNKHFRTGSYLREHLKRVHLKIPNPKTKVCEICGRAFSTNRVLIHHRRTHTGERPYSCPHCSAAFAQKTALYTHMRTQHKTDQQMAITKSVSANK